MWYLTSESDQRIVYIVPQSNEIVVGRNVDCNLTIVNDPSISRKHATLMISDNNLILQDLGSRYGTFVNNSKIEVNNNTKIQNNDVILFGKMHSIWKVHEADLITCTSTLKGENLQNLRSTLTKIGGTLQSDWDDSCAYLTMPAITLTIKVVLALVQGAHIVTTEFWNKCLEAVNNNVMLPDPKSFIPNVVETTLNKEIVSFLPDAQRKSLFNGKKFIFFSRRQFEMYKTVLIRSSATPLLLSESNMSKSMLCNQDVIVIQYNITNSQETQTQRNQINDIINYLKSKGKRVVADAEIGLAILYCLTNKYCNPDFQFTSEVIKQPSSQQSNTKTSVLAEESQETYKQHNKDNIVIDETLTSIDNEGVTSKRKLSEVSDELQSNATKKQAIDNNNTSNINAKRKFNDDDGMSLNPTKKLAIVNEPAEDDDFFNFINPGSADKNYNSTNTSTDKLNLSKPLKRKADFGADEDDLFNFVQDDKVNAETSKHSMFDNVKHLDTVYPPVKKIENECTVEDIAAMRGVKLEELMKSNLNCNLNTLKHHVKKEINDDLDEKMNQLDLGSIIVTVRDDLIVKKEPLQFKEHNNEVKNFKKFKKVWPVKMQMTIIPKSSINIDVHDALQKKSLSNIEK